jgi:hypothetical protein
MVSGSSELQGIDEVFALGAAAGAGMTPDSEAGAGEGLGAGAVIADLFGSVEGTVSVPVQKVKQILLK